MPRPTCSHCRDASSSLSYHDSYSACNTDKGSILCRMYIQSLGAQILGRSGRRPQPLLVITHSYFCYGTSQWRPGDRLYRLPACDRRTNRIVVAITALCIASNAAALTPLGFLQRGRIAAKTGNVYGCVNVNNAVWLSSQYTTDCSLRRNHPHHHHFAMIQSFSIICLHEFQICTDDRYTVGASGSDRTEPPVKTP